MGNLKTKLPTHFEQLPPLRIETGSAAFAMPFSKAAAAVALGENHLYQFAGTLWSMNWLKAKVPIAWSQVLHAQRHFWPKGHGGMKMFPAVLHCVAPDTSYVLDHSTDEETVHAGCLELNMGWELVWAMVCSVYKDVVAGQGPGDLQPWLNLFQTLQIALRTQVREQDYISMRLQIWL